MIERKLQEIINLLSQLKEPGCWEIIGTIVTIIGLLVAIMEFRKSRKATELSNRQSLFDKRLACYFKNKKLLGELTNNWSCLHQIVDGDKNQRGGYINIAFQIFFDASSIHNDHLDKDEIFYLVDIYNKKLADIEIVPDETRILYDFKDKDSGLFASNYIAMLYHLFLARQVYGGNAPVDKRDEEYKKLCVAINELEVSKSEESAILDLMRSELDLNKEIK